MKKSIAAEIKGLVKLERDLIEDIPSRIGEDADVFKAWSVARCRMYTVAYNHAKKRGLKDEDEDGTKLYNKLMAESLAYVPHDYPEFPENTPVEAVYNKTKRDTCKEIHEIVDEYLKMK